MNIIFWITFLVNILFCIYFVLYKKHYFSIYIYVFIGVYIPLFFYMLGWSDLITKDIDDNFYLIFIYLNLGILLSNIIFKNKPKYNIDRFYVKNSRLFIFINLGYIFLYFFESYLGSGSIVPALQHIDIHTYSAPLISFITRSLYTIILMNVLFYLSTKNKFYICMIVLLLLIPIITRGARMQVLISLVQIIFFLLFYFYTKKSKLNKFKIKKRYLLFIGISIVMLIIGMVKYTDYRMNHFGKYDLKYEDTIAYTGPEFMSKFISIYYGYFPLSFNNLNINIKYSDIEHNYLGLYSFKSFYYGIFQLDNIAGINPYLPETNALITAGSATVPTGFYDFYYDFGLFCFIPILLGIYIYIYLYRKIIISNNLIWKMIYFYYLPYWGFMSFQNVLYGSGLLYEIIFIIICYKLFIVHNKNNITSNISLE